MIVIEKLKVLNDVLNKKCKTQFMLSFVANQYAWTKKFLEKMMHLQESSSWNPVWNYL